MIIPLLLLLLSSVIAEAQTADTTVTPADSVVISPVISLPDSIAQSESFSPDTAAINSDTVKVKRHSPSGAMWRSMALPGWGQLYNRKYLKAAVYGGGEIAILYSSLVQHRRYKQAREDEDWTAADFYENDRNRLRWWLAGLILFSMGDAFVDGHLWDFELDKDLSASVEGGLMVVRIRW